MALTPYKLVLKTINEATKPLTYKQVYKLIEHDTDIKPSTVRSYLWRLAEAEKIIKYSKGLYCSTITYGVMVGGLLVHNLCFGVDAPFLGRFEKIDDVVEFPVDSMKIFCQFGKQRRQLTGKISLVEGSRCKGFTREALFLGLGRVMDLFEHYTGRVLESGFWLSSFEANKDYGGTRLKESLHGRISCFSKQEFFEVLTRVYQKDDQNVRAEQKVSRNMRVNEAVAILTGQLGDANLAVGLKNVVDELRGWRETNKWQANKIADLASEAALLVRDLATRRDFNQKQIESLGEKLDRLAVLYKSFVDLAKSNAEMTKANTESLTKLTEMLTNLFGGALVNGKGSVVGKDVEKPSGSGGNPFSV